MQKPITSHRNGLLGSTIVLQAPTKNQVASEISSYISNGALTNALEFLEKRGITGDVALFLVANLQVMGRWEA